MNKAKVLADQDVTTMSQMDIGQVGRTTSGKLVLKIHGGRIVDLSDGGVWLPESLIQVEILPPGTKCELEVNL